MKTIPLTQGKVALVDDGDFDSLSRFKWHAYQHGLNWYAARNQKNEHGLRRPVRMHRQVLGYPNSGIDHRNGNGLDNQKSNLRLATQGQNVANGRIRNTNKCGFKGVYTVRGRKDWRAAITVQGQKIDLGLFQSPEEAHAAYTTAAEKYFGEFARSDLRREDKTEVVTTCASSQLVLQDL